MKRLLGVSASAGSGKTFRLANRYIALLFNDNPSNIIAITFTNKASNEMKERIIKFLKELGEDENVLDMISKEVGIDKEDVLAKRDKLLDSFLTSDVNIQTIDSFINKILRKFSFFAGVRSKFEVGSIDEEIIFKKFLDSLSKEEFNRAIEFAKKEQRFFRLIELFRTLYEKDKELEDINFLPVKRVDEKRAKEAFNRLKDYILNHPQASDRAKRAVDIDFYEVYTTTWFNKDSLKEYRYFSKKIYQDWFEDVFWELKEFFREYFNYVEAKFFSELFYFYNKFKKIYWQIKRDENIFNFKDIENLVYSLLIENELDKDFLYFRLDSKINHILIDEFQDTSITQWEILKPLAKEIASGVGRKENRSFFYVGDVKQAIYRFRGGSKELFFKIPKELPGLEIERLDTNYRSAREIVNFVNEKFSLKENAYRKESGYVEVDEITKENAFEKVLEKIEFLNQNGIKDRDIAILVYRNSDILKLAEFLQDAGKKVVTAKKAKVTSQRSAKAIISLMKYLEDKTKKIELLNFLSLVGREWGEDVDIKIDRPVLMIKEIMDRYKIVDEASLKLLYHSRKYDTLFDFVRGIDKYDEELPFSEFDGITIITIHKSKGLEFKNVIVLDKLTDRDPPGSNILFYYEDAKLKAMKLKIENREKIDLDYKRVYQKEIQLEKEDKINTEYVAFTRAEDGLIILKRDKSAFVTPLKKEKRGKLIPSKDEKITEKVVKEVNVRNYGTQTLEVQKEYKPDDYEAIIFGNAIHYAFECEDIEAVRNRYGDFCNIDEVKRMYERAKKVLPKGKKEIPFIVNKKVGRIDLLCEEEIIDYKSKKPNDESEYINQVKGYIEAVEKITSKKLKGKIFYVDVLEFREINF